MKLNRTSRHDVDAETERWNRQIAQQVNALSEGQIAASYNARTSPPTTGSYSAGDEIKNSAPAELGIATAKYVVRSWICIASGTPGTWVPGRVLTGN